MEVKVIGMRGILLKRFHLTPNCFQFFTKVHFQEFFYGKVATPSNITYSESYISNRQVIGLNEVAKEINKNQSPPPKLSVISFLIEFYSEFHP